MNCPHCNEPLNIGRKRVLSNAQRVVAQKLRRDDKLPLREIASRMNTSLSTIHRAVR